jgi:hypothetical protein
MFSFFQQSEKPREYIPDSVYAICGEQTNACNVCSNVLWSRALNAYVHDTQSGKVFCPFGKGQSLNTPIYSDQAYLNLLNPDKNINTTWGRAPQLDPRPLALIGLEWRTS